ncbi:IclR family transcriptional regulator [uncultured Paracoccus sp.]|uniref:IclR family transcriptional regulator n=1 Tax=uncultured Paracoccus sp. TaxID=189685 RepID=UPI002627B17C|nr:IclR family transcriptional regulator [uncultured Paracoccus sp.]
MPSDPPRPDVSRVVARALDTVLALAAADGISRAELARQLDLPPTTVLRLLTTLAERRMAELDPASQLWTVGPAAFRLGAAFLRRGGLGDRARPILRALADDSGETALLAVADGDGALIVAQAQPPHPVRADLPDGTRLALHATAAGKALIAHLPLQRVHALLGRGDLPALTAATRTDQGDLTADLATIRHSGVAREIDEAAEGLSGLAAPVFGGLGDPVAALALAGPSARLTAARIDLMAPRVVTAARALGTALGGPGGADPVRRELRSRAPSDRSPGPLSGAATRR